MVGKGIAENLQWIAIDWGTSSLRLWAMGRDGAVLARAASPDGMGTLAPADYEPLLLRLAGGWLPERVARAIPVVICGMAGARQGWKEALYRAVPCMPVSSDGVMPVETADKRVSVMIIPGLSQAVPADVMRGEETQLAGLVSRLGGGEVIACLPGTHAKWVRLDAGKVVSFTTVMTGEIFALMAGQSVLRHSVAGEGEDRDVFAGAVREMLSEPSRLTSALFSVRAASLLSGADGASGRARLSGLLIGAELAATRHFWTETPVHLIGSGPLSAAYGEALRLAGGEPVIELGEALTLAGLKAAHASLIREMA